MVHIYLLATSKSRKTVSEVSTNGTSSCFSLPHSAGVTRARKVRCQMKRLASLALVILLALGRLPVKAPPCSWGKSRGCGSKGICLGLLRAWREPWVTAVWVALAGTAVQQGCCSDSREHEKALQTPEIKCGSQDVLWSLLHVSLLWHLPIPGNISGPYPC